jgi:hypothetical protein
MLVSEFWVWNKKLSELIWQKVLGEIKEMPRNVEHQQERRV